MTEEHEWAECRSKWLGPSAGSVGDVSISEWRVCTGGCPETSISTFKQGSRAGEGVFGLYRGYRLRRHYRVGSR